MIGMIQERRSFHRGLCVNLLDDADWTTSHADVVIY
ncbi:hypothetical protein T06_14627 [Trichinella sp. T6]|nr:hypothetical protein T06_14627 [Trichinella sp. T6]